MTHVDSRKMNQPQHSLPFLIALYFRFLANPLLPLFLPVQETQQLDHTKMQKSAYVFHGSFLSISERVCKVKFLEINQVLVCMIRDMIDCLELTLHQTHHITLNPQPQRYHVHDLLQINVPIETCVYNNVVELYLKCKLKKCLTNAEFHTERWL